jgi:predicted transcriptional regulator
MNKKQVAEFLGVSTRIVEKYASQGRLGEINYVRGKTGKQAEYDREAVESLKTILESPDTALTVAKTPDARLFVAQLLSSITTLEESRGVSVRVSEKLLLNLKDCMLLTGLSEQNLRDAIKSEKLKAKIIGRGWKIKKQDLDDFVNNL